MLLPDPEGGNKGGRIIAQGTPEEVAENKNSYTGNFLKMYMDKNLVKEQLYEYGSSR
ncbi:unnamed protein product [marine sediment metagenome]|uniref:Excinuclease ABC subunit A n=1 Tax=marine sediment metagenome TaxID=412755 RepID=X0ZTZ4_9ZZZZ